MRLLIAEDEKHLNKTLNERLTKAGYTVDSCFDGEDAVYYIENTQYDGIILDVMMPRINGFEVLRIIRERKILTPVLMLTAKDSDEDIINGLDLGANDYLTKPFSSTELLARIRVAVRHMRRRQSVKKQSVIRVGGLSVDFEKRIVTLDGKEIHLTPMEYSLLSLLIKNRGKVVTTASVIKELWGPGYGQDTQALRTLMAGLRRKIEENPAKPRYIMTEIGVGYRMIEE